MKGKRVISLAVILIFSVLASGCATREGRLRSGYSNLSIGRYEKAGRYAKFIIERDPAHIDHGALVLMAKAKLAEGKRKKAIEILQKLEKGCPQDWSCPDRAAHIEAKALLALATGKKIYLDDATSALDALNVEMKRNVYLRMISFYEEQGKLIKAAAYADQYMDITPKIKHDVAFHLAVIYASVYQYEKAKALADEYLSFSERQKLMAMFDDIYF